MVQVLTDVASKSRIYIYILQGMDGATHHVCTGRWRPCLLAHMTETSDSWQVPLPEIEIIRMRRVVVLIWQWMWRVTIPGHAAETE